MTAQGEPAPTADASARRVAIVDDQQLVRAGLRALVEGAPDLVVVAEAGDGAAAVQAVRATRPDVVLMDVRMPVMDGIQATRAITAERPSVAVIVLTTFDLDEYVFGAIRAGASGFLLKDGDAEQLRQAIRAAADGDAAMSATSLRRLMDEFARTAAPSAALVARAGTLTSRELEVWKVAAEGLSNREIAARLAIGEATAKTHLSNLLLKLECRDRAQLVVLAYEAGVVRPGRPLAPPINDFTA